MKTWEQIPPEEFAALDLHAHRLLHDVPLHDVWRVWLPGGGSGHSLDDVRSFLSFDALADLNPVVRFLFALRSSMGRLFHIEEDAPIPADSSFLARIPDALLASSRVEPGTKEGPFRVLYALDSEAMSEIRNSTVHAFSVLAMQPDADGYCLHWAIYVAPVGRITRFYMALIDPFRRFLVYPAVLKSIRKRWIANHAVPL